MDIQRKKFIFAVSVFAGGFLFIPIINCLRNYVLDYNYPPLTKVVRYPALAIFVFLYFGYWFYLKMQRYYTDVNKRFIYFAGIALLGLFLCSIYPIFSIDIYEYIMRGRILAIYHSNPYIHPPSDFKQDPYYNIIFWKYHPMIYGPVWAYIVAFLVKIAKNSIFLTQFFLKFALFIFHGLIAFFVYQIAKALHFKKPFVISQAYLLNPFVLITTLVDGHMEVVMIFFLISSLFMLYKRRFYISFLLLSLSFLTKYITILFFPFYIIYMYRKVEDKKDFFKKALISFLVVVAVTVVVYKPLWAGLETFSALTIVRTGFDTNTFPYVSYKIFSFIIPALSKEFFRYCSYAIFGVIYLFSLALFIKTENKQSALVTSINLIFSGYILFGAFQLGAWYLVWLVPFILLSRIPLKYLLVGLITFASLISFWKRISFLIICVLFIYAIILLFTKKEKMHWQMNG